MATALKETTGKCRYHLLIDEFVEEMIGVREHGCEKYADWDWMRGREWSDYIDAMRRHITAFNQGEDLDPESGLNHMAHVAINAMFLYWFCQTKQGTDNRHHVLAERLLEIIRGIDSTKIDPDA